MAVHGELTVMQASSFKAKLEQLLSAGEVTISLKEVKAIDASAFQLIEAFRKENQERRVTVTFPEIKEVNELIKNTGLDKQIL